MRRNQYEESLFRCEDDRFELDMLLESVISAARSAETLLNIITEKKLSFSGSFRIEDHLSGLYAFPGRNAVKILIRFGQRYTRKTPQLLLQATRFKEVECKI